MFRDCGVSYFVVKNVEDVFLKITDDSLKAQVYFYPTSYF